MENARLAKCAEPTAPVVEPLDSRAPGMVDEKDALETAAAPFPARPPAPEPFREGGYGWVVVFACFLLNAHTWGMNSSYAVFLAYYLRNDTFPGTSATAYAFVGGLSISISLLVSPLVTACIPRVGTRVNILIGVFFETIAFIGASFSSKIWQLLLSQGISFGIGMGFIYGTSAGIIAQWFVRRRSFANAIAAGGSGFGGLIYSLATNAMIRHIGLPWSFRAIAIIACAVNTVCALLVRDRNAEVGARHMAFHAALFRRPDFYLFLAWAFFSLLAYIVVNFSLVDYAQTVGRTASQGSVINALFNLSQGLGRPAIGFASDPVGRLNVTALSSLVASLAAFFLWTFAAQYYAGLVVYSLLGGFAGVLWASVVPVAAEVVGVPLLPSALSVLWVVLVLPATFAEVIGLSLRTSAGIHSYLHAQVFTGACFFVSFVFLWLLRALKMYRLERDTMPERTFFSYLRTGRWIFAVKKL